MYASKLLTERSPVVKRVMVAETSTDAPKSFCGAPSGWFYYFHLQTAGKGYRTRVCRSRDLRSWELSPHVVLDYDPEEDRRLHSGVRFTDAERAEIAGAKDVNASDLDMCEFDGGLICCYSWGDQHGNEFLALGRADCTEREFCESFFD